MDIEESVECVAFEKASKVADDYKKKHGFDMPTHSLVRTMEVYRHIIAEGLRYQAEKIEKGHSLLKAFGKCPADVQDIIIEHLEGQIEEGIIQHGK